MGYVLRRGRAGSIVVNRETGGVIDRIEIVEIEIIKSVLVNSITERNGLTVAGDRHGVVVSLFRRGAKETSLLDCVRTVPAS
jgi:hypothetical protein